MPQVPPEIDRAATYFVALAFALLLLLGVGSALISRVRRFIFAAIQRLRSLQREASRGGPTTEVDPSTFVAIDVAAPGLIEPSADTC